MQKLKKLELENVSLTNDFDSCTILSYFSHKDAKIASKLGFHCDNMYSLNGIFFKHGNSQTENTHVVIVSFGESICSRYVYEFEQYDYFKSM